MPDTDNDNDGHPIDGLKPYTIEGHGTCTPPPEPKESE